MNSAEYLQHRDIGQPTQQITTRALRVGFMQCLTLLVETAGLGRLGCFSFIHIIRVHLLTSNPFSFHKNVEIRQL